jgi:hypothetical protein
MESDTDVDGLSAILVIQDSYEIRIQGKSISAEKLDSILPILFGLNKHVSVFEGRVLKV